MKKLLIIISMLSLICVASVEASAQDWGPSSYGGGYGYSSGNDGGTTHRIIAKGYRGMVSVGGGYGWDEFGMNVLTTHGYQFNKYLFLGADVGVASCCLESGLFPAIGVDFRVNVTPDSKVVSFIGVRGGGVYCDFMIGGLCPINDVFGLDFYASVGLSGILFNIGLEF